MSNLNLEAVSQASSKTRGLSFEQHYVFLSGHVVFLSEPLPIFKDLMHLGKLSNEESLKLDLALQEAIANAVEHGNLELSSKLREEFDAEGRDLYAKLKEERLKDNRYAARLIFVSAYADDKEVKVVVRDEGNGFQVNSSEDTNILETNIDLPKCSGRGLILIRAASDAVRYNDVGNQVEFIKVFK